MFPDLVEATKDYWHKLNELEGAYQRGEMSLEQVDARVAELTRKLGQTRQATLNLLWSSFCHAWQTHQEQILGVALISSLTCFWLLLNPIT